jgi:hypothetical protein
MAITLKATMRVMRRLAHNVHRVTLFLPMATACHGSTLKAVSVHHSTSAATSSLAISLLVQRSMSATLTSKKLIRYELGGSYALSPSTKVTAMGFIDEADSAGNVNFGTIGGSAFTGQLSDHRQTGLELGLRKYFTPQAAPFVRSVRPYVEGRLGAAYQDSVFIENAQLGGAAIGTGRLALSDSGWVPSAAGLVGVETPLTRYSTIGLETGIRYTGEPDANITTFAAGSQYEGLNQGGSRVSVPLMLRGRYRF